MQLFRILASGIAFFTFGFVGAVVCFVVMPLLYVLPGARQRRARWVIHKSFAAFMVLLKILRLIHSSAENEEALLRGVSGVYICNHPTLVDVVFLLGKIPNLTCVVKEGVWNNPCMALAVRTAGYIPNRSTEQLIDQCIQTIVQKGAILIFPEGTRSLPTGLRDFKRGVARIALGARCDIHPLVMTCTPPTLAKGQPWYDRANQCCQMVLKPSKPFRFDSFKVEGVEDALAARQITRQLEEFYGEQLEEYFKKVKRYE